MSIYFCKFSNYTDKNKRIRAFPEQGVEINHDHLSKADATQLLSIIILNNDNATFIL